MILRLEDLSQEKGCYMVRLNESVKVFKGTFVDANTFLDKDGNPYDLIPSVMEEPELSQEDQDKIKNLSNNEYSNDSQGLDWQGETKQRKGKVVVDIQTPDPTMSYIDDDTGNVYKWDTDKEIFVEISGGNE